MQVLSPYRRWPEGLTLPLSSFPPHSVFEQNEQSSDHIRTSSNSRLCFACVHLPQIMFLGSFRVAFKLNRFLTSWERAKLPHFFRSHTLSPVSVCLLRGTLLKNGAEAVSDCSVLLGPSALTGTEKRLHVWGHAPTCWELKLSVFQCVQCIRRHKGPAAWERWG